MSVRNSLKAIPLNVFNAAGLGALYQPINALGLPHSCNIIRIINNNTTAITISYDGVVDHEYLAPNSSLTLDCQSNAQPNSFSSLFVKGTRVFVRGTAGAGTIALAGYFNPPA